MRVRGTPKQKFVFWTVVIGGAAFVAYLLLLPEPAVLAAVDAESEYVSFAVANPGLAAFYLPEAEAFSGGTPGAHKVTGLFEPTAGSIITYRRNTRDLLSIEVAPPSGQPAGTLVPERHAGGPDPEPVPYGGRVGFRIAVAPDSPPPRLPIWGVMTLGQEFAAPSVPRRPDARLLLQGKLTVSGISERGSVLYPISSIDLPVGARLGSIEGNGAYDKAGRTQIWWGSVDIKPDEPQLHVRAVSEARSIALYRPGSQHANIVGVSTTAQLTDDPGRLRAQLLIAALIGGVGLLAGLGGHIHELLGVFRAPPVPRKTKLLRDVKHLLLAGLFAATPARAEVVRLTVGDNTFGQGWLFWDLDRTCKVVTARHVIAGPSDQLRSALVVDGRGTEHRTGPALVDSKEFDVAVLPVEASDPAQVCPLGRLNPLGLERRIQTDSRVTVDTTGRTQVRHVPANLSIAARDAGGGERFAVLLDEGAGPAAEGWSGSIVLDGDGPIGLVQQLAPRSDRELLALRLDVVRRLIDTVPRGIGVSAPRPLVELTQGSTLVSATGGGPEQVLRSAGSWRIQPVGGRIGLSLTFPAPTSLHGMTIGFEQDGAASVQGVGIETIADPARPSAVGESVYSRRAGGQFVYSFQVSPRIVRQIRVTIATDADVAIRQISPY